MNRLFKALSIACVFLSLTSFEANAAMGMIIWPATTPQQVNPYAGAMETYMQAMLMAEQVKAQQLQNQLMEEKLNKRQRRAATY
jgi:hypothetical protein